MCRAVAAIRFTVARVLEHAHLAPGPPASPGNALISSGGTAAGHLDPRSKSWTLLMDLHTKLARHVCFKAVAIHHCVDGFVERHLLGTQICVLIAVALVALDGKTLI